MVFDGIGSRKGRGPTKWGGPSKTIGLRLFKLFLISEDIFKCQDLNCT